MMLQQKKKLSKFCGMIHIQNIPKKKQSLNFNNINGSQYIGGIRDMFIMLINFVCSNFKSNKNSLE